MTSHHQWLAEAVRRIETDLNRSADTHLIRVDLPRHCGVPVYLKDESSHPTGSLKHRLARSLFQPLQERPAGFDDDQPSDGHRQPARRYAQADWQLSP